MKGKNVIEINPVTEGKDYCDCGCDCGKKIRSGKPHRPENVKEGAAWTKKEGKNKSGGLNEKGRKSYERERILVRLKHLLRKRNPRRKSFCARMKGMKKKLTSSKTANDPDSRINKSQLGTVN